MDVSLAALPELVGHRLRYDRLIAPSATDGHILVVASGVFTLQAPAASGGTWGSITGTLSAQTDLQSALDAKLATATAASTYQPLDADLTSLAGLTWTGTTSYLRSDKTLATLNQAAVAGLTTADSPTFAGEVLTPTADGQSVLRINAADGTRSISVGTFPSAANYAGLWIDSATPSTTNFTLLAGGGETVVNAATGGTVALRIANSTALTANATDVKSAKPLSPTTNDGAALGTSSLGWSDLFLASGGVINFNNGDVTITHSSNTLAFAGASSGYTFDGLISIGLNVILEGPSANVLEQRNSTSAQTYRFYGTYTGASNYVRGALSASTTAVTLAAETAGTGADDIDIIVATAGTGSIRMGNSTTTTGATGSAICIGNSSQSIGTTTVAIGGSADARGVNSVCIGVSATATNTTGYNVAIGGATTCTGYQGTAIGAAATTGTGSTAVGYNVNCSTNYTVGLGYNITVGTAKIGVGLDLTLANRSIGVGTFINTGTSYDVYAFGTNITGLSLPNYSSAIGGSTDTSTGHSFHIVGCSSTVSRVLKSDVCTWVTATDASRKARVVHNIYDTAARECMRMESSGTAAMIGFLGASAIVRPTTADAAATFTANTSGIANDTATFDGYTIGQVVKALRNLGLLA